MVTGATILQDGNQMLENEGLHAFAESLYTNQRIKIG
jgi:hypothetical protein